MYSGIRPFQFVKTHKEDYLFKVGGNFYIQSKYAGRVEVSEEEYERLKGQGMVERWVIMSNK